jgi:hypothetical protein
MSRTWLKVINILFWIAFIGLCIKAGALLISSAISVFASPEAAANLYLGLNLSQLYTYSILQYIAIVSFLILITTQKAGIAFYAIKFFQIFQLDRPFDVRLADIFMKISHTALLAGGLAIIAHRYSQWISKKGVPIPIDWGGNEIVFFAGVIYLLALTFKKGAELQQEQDLTV